MSDTLRKNYSELFNGYSLPGWKLDYGKLERMVSEADDELTVLRAKLAEAEKLIACYRQHIGEVITYGSDAETLDKQLQMWVPRARNAEAKLAFLKTKGLTVVVAKDAGQPEKLVYVIEDGSELCDGATIAKLVDAEVQVAQLRANLAAVREAGHHLLRTIQGWRSTPYRIVGGNYEQPGDGKGE